MRRAQGSAIAEATHELRTIVEDATCDAEDIVEKYKNEAPNIIRTICDPYVRMAFTGLGRLSIAAGLGVIYLYGKRSLGKHGAVYLAMKKNFQDMGYIITANQGQSLGMEQLGILMYISRQLYENASVVFSSDELQLLRRDLDHIADSSISTASKLETLKFMQRNYSFLAQEKAIII